MQRRMVKCRREGTAMQLMGKSPGIAAESEFRIRIGMRVLHARCHSHPQPMRMSCVDE